MSTALPTTPRKSVCMYLRPSCSIQQSSCYTCYTEDSCRPAIIDSCQQRLSWQNQHRAWATSVCTLFQISLSLLCTSPQFVNWRFANFKNNSRIFTARRVCIARTMPWQDVCPSVCPSHAGIVSINISLQGHDERC